MEIKYQNLRVLGPAILKVKIPDEILDKLNDYIDKIILLLTIFGIGSFSYHAYTYVPQVAARVSYPAIIIIILFLDRVLRKDNLAIIRTIKTLNYFRKPIKLISFILICFFSFCTSLFIRKFDQKCS